MTALELKLRQLRFALKCIASKIEDRLTRKPANTICKCGGTHINKLMCTGSGKAHKYTICNKCYSVILFSHN